MAGENIGFNIEDVIFDDYIIQKIINNYTDNEKGVRNLKRCITTIIEKLNVLKLINGYTQEKKTKESKIVSKSNNISLEINEKTESIDESKIVSFNIPHFSLPLHITDTIVNKLLIISKTNNVPFGLYM